MNKQLQDLLEMSFDKLVPIVKKLAEKVPEAPENPLKSQKHNKEMFSLRCDEGSEQYKKQIQKGYEIIVEELKKSYH